MISTVSPEDYAIATFVDGESPFEVSNTKLLPWQTASMSKFAESYTLLSILYLSIILLHNHKLHQFYSFFTDTQLYFNVVSGPVSVPSRRVIPAQSFLGHDSCFLVDQRILKLLYEKCEIGGRFVLLVTNSTTSCKLLQRRPIQNRRYFIWFSTRFVILKYIFIFVWLISILTIS